MHWPVQITSSPSLPSLSFSSYIFLVVSEQYLECYAKKELEKFPIFPVWNSKCRWVLWPLSYTQIVNRKAEWTQVFGIRAFPYMAQCPFSYIDFIFAAQVTLDELKWDLQFLVMNMKDPSPSFSRWLGCCQEVQMFSSMAYGRQLLWRQ